MIVVRSALFTVVFYVTTVAYLIAALPTLALPHRTMGMMAKAWARTSVWLLRVICDVSVEWRGLDKMPRGALLVAAKHQSAWETFALLPLFADPSFIIKRELTWIPLYGWYTRKAGMIPVDRTAGRAALIKMTRAARRLLDQGRQILIFPEGTRSAPGAPPDYKPGIALLYADLGVPCLPIALNSGLHWPRRSFLRPPGTILVEILDPIPPGLARRAFMARLQDTIESATARLVAEGQGRSLPPGDAAAAAQVEEASVGRS
ncbi:lysophospholipid acyltransferase family protein [Rhodoplanes roseus]|uniref:1-acyl-sn-glycerol-3-phosphate acyltransferase n=1 Tax=Rhodoplanes roseus TaxID=29409 RepID=A0A327KK30_9BRAD|nr:lysophospholipid acyltransferase family protein [Rhodoplanes roseus]RAI38446.1 1-acyl-sn-glycerol-3-phosphate acyltransferase [Rhodoplanes roseus]